MEDLQKLEEDLIRRNEAEDEWLINVEKAKEELEELQEKAVRLEQIKWIEALKANTKEVQKMWPGTEY